MRNDNIRPTIAHAARGCEEIVENVAIAMRVGARRYNSKRGPPSRGVTITQPNPH